ncbi:hypothetical protein QTP88_006237 [Uroleucon formosanum]
MDKRKVFDIFKFRKVIKKDDFPLTNNVDTQEQNDQLVDDPDSCSTKTETIQVQDRPSDKPFSHTSSSTFTNSLDTDLGDMDSGPMRPMLKVYPKTKFGTQNRSFTSVYYTRFDWLEYSVKMNAVFCFACRIFSNDYGNSENTFTITGFSNWKKANDTALLSTADDHITASLQLQSHIDTLSQWFTKWKIKVNESKSSFVTFALRPLNCPPISMNNTIIPHSNEVKYLGLIFDRRLTWSSHLKDKRKKLNSRLHLLRPLLRSNLALPLKLILYKTLLQPLWVYGVVIWGSAKQSNKRTIQAFQNICCRIITGAPCITMTDSSTILRILRELSEDESGEESGMEVEDIVDDSDEDPDYVPNKHNFQTEEEISEVIREIETRPIPPLKSRKRKINSQTDSNNGENERETDQNKHIITIYNTSEIVGKNGFIWKTECNYSSGKVPQKNIVHIRPGPSYLAKSAYTPKECFKLFFTDELINLVLIYTNQEIQRQRENYKNKTSANLRSNII